MQKQRGKLFGQLGLLHQLLLRRNMRMQPERELLLGQFPMLLGQLHGRGMHMPGKPVILPVLRLFLLLLLYLRSQSRRIFVQRPIQLLLHPAREHELLLS